jgi:hypothetical protein
LLLLLLLLLMLMRQVVYVDRRRLRIYGFARCASRPMRQPSVDLPVLKSRQRITRR